MRGRFICRKATLNSLSALDLHATPQCTQMAAAIKSWITRLELGEKFYGGLIRVLFQPLEHLTPVSCAALRKRATCARLVAESTAFGPRNHDAPSTRILTPLLHALCQRIYVLRRKSSGELDAEFVEVRVIVRDHDVGPVRCEPLAASHHRSLFSSKPGSW